MLARVGGACALAGAATLLTYLAWNLAVPPFPSARAFLEYASANPLAAFGDDYLFLAWLVLTMPVVLAVHRRMASAARDEALLASAVGLLGLGVAVTRSVFNLGRLQTLASGFSVASEADRETLMMLLAWTEQGDVARNLALALVGGWVLWSGWLALRARWLQRWVGWLGVAAGASVVPAVIAYLAVVPLLTSPAGYLALVFVLWAAWLVALGWHLLATTA